MRVSTISPDPFMRLSLVAFSGIVARQMAAVAFVCSGSDRRYFFARNFLNSVWSTLMRFHADWPPILTKLDGIAKPPVTEGEVIRPVRRNYRSRGRCISLAP